MIDWSGGKVHTEVKIPAGDTIPNIGKYLNNNTALIKDELRQNLIKAMGYVRISDIFLLKDYYAMKSDIRYEIISYADRAFYYPMLEKGGNYTGMVELNLYGKDGIAGIFFRDLERITPTNYIREDSQDLEYFDGLIIDMINYKEFNPSIQLRIYDQDDNLLYGPETVDKDALEKQGVCEYTATLKQAFNSPRSGSHIFYITPYEIKGRMNTYIVLNNKDAARLFASPRTVKLLNQGRVVVVKPPQ